MTINTHGLKPGATFKYPYRVKEWRTSATISIRSMSPGSPIRPSNLKPYRRLLFQTALSICERQPY